MNIWLNKTCAGTWSTLCFISGPFQICLPFSCVRNWTSEVGNLLFLERLNNQECLPLDWTGEIIIHEWGDDYVCIQQVSGVGFLAFRDGDMTEIKLTLVGHRFCTESRTHELGTSDIQCWNVLFTPMEWTLIIRKGREGIWISLLALRKKCGRLYLRVSRLPFSVTCHSGIHDHCTLGVI